jgi:hypothetical protein
MKRIIYFVLAILVCGIYVGCSENEIDLYDQTPRINFYGSTTHVRTLVDTDYVKKEPYAVDSFEVRIQGDFLKENRDFCVKVTPNNDYQNSVDVLLESKYTYTDLDNHYSELLSHRNHDSLSKNLLVFLPRNCLQHKVLSSHNPYQPKYGHA